MQCTQAVHQKKIVLERSVVSRFSREGAHQWCKSSQLNMQLLQSTGCICCSPWTLLPSVVLPSISSCSEACFSSTKTPGKFRVQSSFVLQVDSFLYSSVWLTLEEGAGRSVGKNDWTLKCMHRSDGNVKYAMFPAKFSDPGLHKIRTPCTCCLIQYQLFGYTL